MRITILLLMLTCACTTRAQHKVRFLLKEETAIQHDSIYITGTFTNWDSTFNPAFRLKPEGGGNFSIVLDLPPGAQRYKFTRGNWNGVEKSFMGSEIADRKINIQSDTVFRDTVTAWRDEIFSDKWHSISIAKKDSSLILSYYALANIYGNFPEWHNLDSAYYYISKTLLLAQELKATVPMNDKQQTEYNRLLIYSKELSAFLLHGLGNFSKELELRLENLNIAEKQGDTHQVLDACSGIANAYLSMQDFQRMLDYSRKMYSYVLSEKNYDSTHSYHYVRCYKNLSLAFFNLNQFDSALYYAQKLYNYQLVFINTTEFGKAAGGQLIGDIYLKTGKDSLALQYYRSVLPIAYANYSFEGGIRARYGLAQILFKRGLIDSAINNARQVMSDLKSLRAELQTWEVNTNSMLSEFSPFLAELYYAKKQPDSAYHYLKLSVAIKDSLFNLEKVRQFQNLTLNESLRSKQQEQELRTAKQEFQSRMKVYSLVAGLGILSILAIILFRNNRQQQKAKSRIENAYSTLRSTQAQLIQQEKMASLGELTTGIAHEIQNPLNFVNNFSEVNTELLRELSDGPLNKLPDMEKNEALAIIKDLNQNLEKINHHGKRADSIVKAMLQHSRTSSGQKEPTDINALADEYLRLSYHGMRAKDKSFSPVLNTDFDTSIGKISVIPQDIGRVLMNLYNNAFYAVKEKTKMNSSGFEGIISVTTKRLDGKVVITVTDNGTGISENVKGKIFQPFFTTKPAGSGTGLGLSLSYDIITKGHGGEIGLYSKEGEGAVFTILLPP